ncbi:hypothetical protein [Streptomyces melanogenes]|uniref:hypothetical protein n=1 Tax=Streptomyces melanogenes TaxID=67326 RepID=UPI0037971685
MTTTKPRQRCMMRIRFHLNQADGAAVFNRLLTLVAFTRRWESGPSPMIAAVAAAENPPGRITVIPPTAVTAFLNPRPVAAL